MREKEIRESLTPADIFHNHDISRFSNSHQRENESSWKHLHDYLSILWFLLGFVGNNPFMQLQQQLEFSALNKFLPLARSCMLFYFCARQIYVNNEQIQNLILSTFDSLMISHSRQQRNNSNSHGVWLFPFLRTMMNIRNQLEKINNGQWANECIYASSNRELMFVALQSERGSDHHKVYGKFMESFSGMYRVHIEVSLRLCVFLSIFCDDRYCRNCHHHSTENANHPILNAIDAFMLTYPIEIYRIIINKFGIEIFDENYDSKAGNC